MSTKSHWVHVFFRLYAANISALFIVIWQIVFLVGQKSNKCQSRILTNQVMVFSRIIHTADWPGQLIVSSRINDTLQTKSSGNLKINNQYRQNMLKKCCAVRRRHAIVNISLVNSEIMAGSCNHCLAEYLHGLPCYTRKKLRLV